MVSNGPSQSGTPTKQLISKQTSSMLTTNTRLTSGSKKGSLFQLKIVGWVGLYYFFSIAVSLFNTHLFNRYRYNFPFPILAAAIYSVFQFTFASLCLVILNGPEGFLATFNRLKLHQFLYIILPCGLASGLDIAFSNYSLKYVSLSLYTMVKSSSPMFVLICAFFLGLETPSWHLASIIGIIGVGTILTVWDSIEFHLGGFSLLFLASFLAGVRWSLTQLIIEHEADQNGITGGGPFATMIYITPVVGGTLVILSAAIEGPFRILSHFSSFEAVATSLGICCIGGLLTFLLITFEYKVVEATSVVTFAVSGIVKELLLIGLSVVIFKDRLKLVNFFGAIVSISGIVFYNFYRIKKKRKRISHEDVEKMRSNAEATTNIFIAVASTSDPMPSMINPFYDDDEADDEESIYFDYQNSSLDKSPRKHAKVMHKLNRNKTDESIFLIRPDGFKDADLLEMKNISQPNTVER